MSTSLRFTELGHAYDKIAGGVVVELEVGLFGEHPELGAGVHESVTVIELHPHEVTGHVRATSADEATDYGPLVSDDVLAAWELVGDATAQRDDLPTALEDIARIVQLDLLSTLFPANGDQEWPSVTVSVFDGDGEIVASDIPMQIGTIHEGFPALSTGFKNRERIVRLVCSQHGTITEFAHTTLAGVNAAWDSHVQDASTTPAG